MKALIGAMPLLLSLLCAACSTAADDAAASGNHDDREVISAALEVASPHHWPIGHRSGEVVVLADQTLASDPSYTKWFESNLPGETYNDCVQDLVRRNVVITKTPTVARPEWLALADKGDLGQIRVEVGSWRGVYPSASGMVRISLPGYCGRKAVVFVSLTAEPPDGYLMSGSGVLVVLEYGDSGWRVVSETAVSG